MWGMVWDAIPQRWVGDPEYLDRAIRHSYKRDSYLNRDELKAKWEGEMEALFGRYWYARPHP